MSTSNTIYIQGRIRGKGSEGGREGGRERGVNSCRRQKVFLQTAQLYHDQKKRKQNGQKTMSNASPQDTPWSYRQDLTSHIT